MTRLLRASELNVISGTCLIPLASVFQASRDYPQLRCLSSNVCPTSVHKSCCRTLHLKVFTSTGRESDAVRRRTTPVLDLGAGTSSVVVGVAFDSSSYSRGFASAVPSCMLSGRRWWKCFFSFRHRVRKDLSAGQAEKTVPPWILAFHVDDGVRRFNKKCKNTFLIRHRNREDRKRLVRRTIRPVLDLGFSRCRFCLITCETEKEEGMMRSRCTRHCRFEEAELQGLRRRSSARRL